MISYLLLQSPRWCSSLWDLRITRDWCPVWSKGIVHFLIFHILLLYLQPSRSATFKGRWRLCLGSTAILSCLRDCGPSIKLSAYGSQSGYFATVWTKDLPRSYAESQGLQVVFKWVQHLLPPNWHVLCSMSKLSSSFWKLLYGSNNKLSKKLRNSIKIWTGQAVLELLIQTSFWLFWSIALKPLGPTKISVPFLGSLNNLPYNAWYM